MFRVPIADRREFFTRLAIALAMGLAPLLLVSAALLIPSLRLPLPVILTLLLVPVLLGAALSVAKEHANPATSRALVGDTLAMFALVVLAIFGGFAITVATASLGLVAAVPWAMALLAGAVTVGDQATARTGWGAGLAFCAGAAIMLGYVIFYLVVALLNQHQAFSGVLEIFAFPLVMVGAPLAGVISLGGARLRAWMAVRLLI